MQTDADTTRAVITTSGLRHLIDTLRAQGYSVVGPTLSDGAIVYVDVSDVEQLPAGWTDIQEAGSYRIQERRDGALFGYTVGPHSWKKYLHPALATLWRAQRTNGSFTCITEDDGRQPLAFLGVRACELAAIAIHDQIFLSGPYADPIYRARREKSFLVAVNCTRAGGTCFCASMGTGPRATSGHDLALTELIDGSSHNFLVEVATNQGRDLLSQIPHDKASAAQVTQAEQLLHTTARSMGRSLDTVGIKELLYRNTDSPHWDKVASRCLTCGNCTMVCPTCFCTTVEDTTDLSGHKAERRRRWDSCFTMDFSYIHGGAVRASARSRYRQWMTHKLASWIDQFGRSGCVGCGRCITWCPVGIDITAEAAALRDGEIETHDPPLAEESAHGKP